MRVSVIYHVTSCEFDVFFFRKPSMAALSGVIPCSEEFPSDRIPCQNLCSFFSKPFYYAQWAIGFPIICEHHSGITANTKSLFDEGACSAGATMHSQTTALCMCPTNVGLRYRRNHAIHRGIAQSPDCRHSVSQYPQGYPVSFADITTILV